VSGRGVYTVLGISNAITNLHSTAVLIRVWDMEFQFPISSLKSVLFSLYFFIGPRHLQASLRLLCDAIRDPLSYTEGLTQHSSTPLPGPLSYVNSWFEDLMCISIKHGYRYIFVKHGIICGLFLLELYLSFPSSVNVVSPIFTMSTADIRYVQCL
jgi:hypothetical protein